jgi:hypothetical protein
MPAVMKSSVFSTLILIRSEDRPARYGESACLARISFARMTPDCAQPTVLFDMLRSDQR